MCPKCFSRYTFIRGVHTLTFKANPGFWWVKCCSDFGSSCCVLWTVCLLVFFSFLSSRCLFISDLCIWMSFNIFHLSFRKRNTWSRQKLLNCKLVFFRLVCYKYCEPCGLDYWDGDTQNIQFYQIHWKKNLIEYNRFDLQIRSPFSVRYRVPETFLKYCCANILKKKSFFLLTSQETYRLHMTHLCRQTTKYGKQNF